MKRVRAWLRRAARRWAAATRRERMQWRLMSPAEREICARMLLGIYLSAGTGL